MARMNKAYDGRALENRLALMRKENNLTQSVLAEKLGTTQARVSRIERGEARLSSKEKRRLRSAFAVNPAVDWVPDPCAELDELFDMQGKLRVSWAPEVAAKWEYLILVGLCYEPDYSRRPEPLGDIELVFAGSAGETSQTTWKEIFGDQPSGWKG